jgi:hypothetical protein
VPEQHLFISYAHADHEEADFLTRGLAGCGLPVWRDASSLDCGEIWTDAITDAIIDARGVVLLGSVPSFSSIHVKKELHIACDEGKKVFPVMLEACPFPGWARYVLAGTHCLNVPRRGFSSGCSRVCESIKALLSVSARGKSEHVPRRSVERSFALRLSVLYDGAPLGAADFDRDVVSVGRRRTCDLVPRLFLPDETQQEKREELLQQSRTHAYIRYQDGRLFLNDVSRWGTQLNGAKVTDVLPLGDGDIIAIGRFQIVCSTIPLREVRP